ncbi:hypothetical protein EUX98_g8527 [Antrodiella citrinella]|uniref:Uncharacterized protein n=1 Tax=Antrodiella citrinella TaxID=2447956 RepID=A0A4S4M6L6_9APHY|nr:hypothetical protein EUX98_g8527 [Antrodiella citrinella]
MPKCSPVFGYYDGSYEAIPALLSTQLDPAHHCQILQNFAGCTCPLTLQYTKMHLDTLVLRLQPVVPEEYRKCRCPTFSVDFAETPALLESVLAFGRVLKLFPNIRSRVNTMALSLSDLDFVSHVGDIEDAWKHFFNALSSLQELHLLNVNPFDDALVDLASAFNADIRIGCELRHIRVVFRALCLDEDDEWWQDGVCDGLWYALAANCRKLKFVEMEEVPFKVSVGTEWIRQQNKLLDLLARRQNPQAKDISR